MLLSLEYNSQPTILGLIALSAATIPIITISVYE